MAFSQMSLGPIRCDIYMIYIYEYMRFFWGCSACMRFVCE